MMPLLDNVHALSVSWYPFVRVASCCIIDSTVIFFMDALRGVDIG